MQTMMQARPRGLWNSYVAGVVLGLVLLATFLVTGHGLGVTGATTSATAVVAGHIAPATVAPHSYLANYFKFGLNTWIVWEVIGLMAGALVSSLLGRRFRLQFDGPPRASTALRVILPIGGGAISGFGARMAMGCTSGMGLSGSAVLGAAGFLFLIGFFITGATLGQWTKGLWA